MEDVASFVSGSRPAFRVLECLVHFVYIVRCADGTLYTGYARDPRARVAVHNTGRGARYTSGRRPVRLVYSEEYESHGAALSREYELKRWTRRRKEALIKLRKAARSTTGTRPTVR
jgi:putative endonuclease